MNLEASRKDIPVHIRQIGAEDFDDILSPNVAKLNDAELRRLTALASIALVAADSGRVVGYVLAMSSSNVYEGEEFQSFLAEFYEPVLYIDQVAVSANARGAKIASQMYAYLQQRCHELGILTLCCEVNQRPGNPVSMEFHRKLGFGSIGGMETRDGWLVTSLRKKTPPMSSSFRAITKANKQDLPRLFEVWESSVRATHSFLTEADIQSLIPLVKTELANFNPIYCLRNDDGKLFAFSGVVGSKIEMLFVHARNRGSGAGRLLSEFAIQVLHADRVDVNEQNDQAIGFYRRLGFRQISRSPLDSAGNTFPILHLVLQPVLLRQSRSWR